MDTTTHESRLQAEKETLERELERMGRRNPHNLEDFEAVVEDTGAEADEGDRAEQLEQYAENATLVEELEQRHTEVLRALEHIRLGTYGTCSVCGEAIEPERLHADPAAPTCTQHR